MNLVRVQDLADKAARVHARDWFDRFAKAYVGDAVARDNARDQLESHLIEALESDPQASVQRVDEALARLGVPEEIAAAIELKLPRVPIACVNSHLLTSFCCRGGCAHVEPRC